MSRPNYREQDGCWNCGHYDWTNDQCVRMAIVSPGVLKENIKHIEEYAICDDWIKEEG